MVLPANFNALIEQAIRQDLYKKLIQQLNKDFLYASIDLELDDGILPKDLKSTLHEKLYRLIQEKFADYLNLLYIIDVSERKVKQLDGSDLLKLSEAVAFLILQREWQKICYRSLY